MKSVHFVGHQGWDKTKCQLPRFGRYVPLRTTAMRSTVTCKSCRKLLKTK